MKVKTAHDRKIEVMDLGLADYRECLDVQLDILEKRIKGIVPDTLIMVEHHPVLTMGRLSRNEEVIDRRYFELASMFRIGRMQRFREVIIPAITPFLFSGIATAIGFGWRAVIIGEVLSQPEFGIGTRMQVAHIYLLIGPLIAWTVIAILISYLFDVILRRAEKRIIKWR